ncbi:carotenoid oxygenase family protein [Parvibaculum sp.]|uniref:carotenoid oxygenase family protein n=1 Tax=Parvibaculum sp. TaxID=2024848 RepID=UPI002B76A7A3|nr:carotenoid oxygenase family protein [Parvibaculum sp.]HUD51000.1 carotenoid oxygenase family protein [Parvibaculum sp.]
MSKPFPNNPMLQGNFAPVMAECAAPDLIVAEGEIPAGMNGTLYRNGPNPMFPPLGNQHHWFLGEGMIHAIHLEDGKASYRNRWVQTEQYRAQRKAGHRLIGTGFGEPPAPGGEGVAHNVANTNVVWHGGKLLALDEGSRPFAMDGDTLEPKGSWTFEGKYEGPMTAHPKFDPKTGEMLFFGYMAAGPGTPDISYQVVDASGRLTRSEMFKAPYASMVHDFITTDEHVIFPIFPATIDVERIMKGGPVIAWDPSVGTRVGIMARNASVETIRWFEGDPCYVYHPMNAWTVHEGGKTKVVADVMKYDRVPLFPNADGSKADTRFEGAASVLVRWTFDLDGNTNAYSEEQLTDLGGEFPRLDERFTGLGYRHGFYAANTRPLSAGKPFDTLVHLDLATGKRRTFDPGAGRYVMEPVFVPRSAAAPEGDGWLTTLVYDEARNLSDFVVLDTDDISKGPIARVELPTRVPFGFHGNWRGAA